MRNEHSPSDYSRDRLEPERHPSNRSDTSGTQLPSSSPFATIARLITPPRVVFNPKHQSHETNGPVIARQIGGKPAGHVPRSQDRGQASRRQRRSQDPIHAIGQQIRSEEHRLLLEVGRFRVIAVTDLAREIYAGNSSQLRHDLEFLKQKGLVECHFLNVRRDARSHGVRRFEAVTLTKAAHKLLAETGQVPHGQRIYSGLVKPREAEHDAQIFRAFLKEATEIGRAGGTNVRVRLDFELKARINLAVYLARRAEPQKDVCQVKAEIAQQFGLKLQNNKVAVPDARLEYDLPSGGTGQVDIEVATSAYRHDHIAAKVQAGFKLYISNGDAGRLGAAVQDDHDLMSEILDI
jgi:hypothetical protein